MSALSDEQRERLAEALGDFGIYFLGAHAEAVAGVRDPERWDHEATEEAMGQFVESIVEVIADEAAAEARVEVADRLAEWEFPAGSDALEPMYRLVTSLRARADERTQR